MKRCLLIVSIALIFHLSDNYVAFGATAPLDSWRTEFKNPPRKAGPYVWWHWLGYNVSKEGITRDLESMSEAGIAGLTLFQVSDHATNRVPSMNVQINKQMSFHNNEWWNMLRHSLSEAKRLNLEFGMHNCPGWSVSGGPWIKPENSMQKIVWTSQKVNGPGHIELKLNKPETLCNYYKDIAVLLVPAGVPAIKDIKVITEKMNEYGLVMLEIPKGEFNIYRFGHTTTGQSPAPVPADIINSLEADKMSEKAMCLHMQNVLEPLKKEVGAYVGNTLKYLLFDSYEAGSQNWTPQMPTEFENLKSYNLLYWLPVIAGRTIENAQKSDKFKSDFNDVIQTLFARYSYELPKKLLKELNLEMHIEPYASNGVGPFNMYDVTAIADVPMTEFWSHQIHLSEPKVIPAANFAGKNIIAAEAFTGSAENSRWSESLPDFKQSGDMAFVEGVNRLILHHWVHQPFSEQVLPGMSMGRWGSHFGRNQLWYNESKVWIEYLTRCQYLLQKGLIQTNFVTLESYVPGSDAVSADALSEQLKVKNGKLYNTDGREYEFLYVPTRKKVTDEVLSKINNLEKQGAKVFFDSVPHTAPGLLVEKGDKIRWIQRKNADANLFFINNNDSAAQMCEFIFTGMRGNPQLWNPVNGEISELLFSSEGKNRIKIIQRFEAGQSCFIVFGNSLSSGYQIRQVEPSAKNIIYELKKQNDKFWVMSDSLSNFDLILKTRKKMSAKCTSPVQITELNNNWNVAFKPAIGSEFKRYFDSLSYWNRTFDDSLKYFSGTAVYTQVLDITLKPDLNYDKYELDLGEVGKVATVYINDVYCASLWHFPYKTDITPYLRKGKNQLRIDVTNTWSNFLIGEQRLKENYNSQLELFNGKGESLGAGAADFPDWILKNERPMTNERQAFSSWNYFVNYNRLTDSGLRGPIKLIRRSWQQFN